MKLLSLALLLSTTAPAPPGGGTFQITSCNLGCGGAPGQQISCGIAQVPPNVQLSIEWNDDVELSSVSLISIQIVNTTNGLTPAGAYSLKDARTIVFTPAAPGFDAGATYQILIPGTAQGDPGPFVTSTSGAPNLARLQCAFTASGPASSVANACQTSPNSVGAGALTSWFGSSSLTLNDLSVVVNGLPSGMLAVPIASNSSAALPFGDGFLCLGAPILRLTPTNTLGGSAAFDVDWTATPGGFDTSPGASVRIQLWYRDPAGGPAGFNLSDGVVADLIP